MRIDVHAHYFAPEYVALLSRLSGVERRFGMNQSLEQQLALAATAGIELQVLSVGPAQPYLAREADAVEAARFVNDLFADLGRQRPGQLRAFGSVPLPHVEAALAETERCLDRLGALGISVGCSVNGRPLDDPEFEPFFAELDRRGAVLFLHPVGAGAGPGTAEYGLTWMIGAPFEDTISGLRLVLSGLTRKFPNVRIIIPHLGGTLPFLMARMDYIQQNHRATGLASPPMRDDPSPLVRKLWFDTVNLYPAALRCACEAFGPERLLLGTDFPFLMGDNYRACVSYVRQALPAEQADAILEHNAQALLGL